MADDAHEYHRLTAGEYSLPSDEVVPVQGLEEAMEALSGAAFADAQRDDDLAALLLSINCIAAGFGTTG